MNRVHTGAYILLALSLVFIGYLLNETIRQRSSREAAESRASSAEIQLEMERKKSEVLEQHKTRVVVVTKPDGTRVETQEESSTTRTTETETSTTKTEKRQETVVSSKKTQYSVTPEWRDLGPYAIPTGMSVGARLGSLPLWMEAGWDKKAGAHVGVRFEW